MKRIFLLIGLLTLLFSVETFAKHVNENTAKQVGQSFFLDATSFKVLKTSASFELIYKADANNSNSNQKSNQQTTFFYVFSTGTNGFVIVAGDDNVIPILGYSDEGTFDPNNIPPNVAKWLEGYKNQIRYVVDNNISATQEIQDEWTNYLNGTVQKSHKATTAVNPLIQTKWNQSPNYNALCPYDNSSGQRSVTGCVATAMAQIMKFWNYPTTGSGFHSYNHQRYGTLSANFGSTTYQWNSMPNNVSSSNNAVATLMYHCGVSVDMNYNIASAGGSGAYVISAESPIQHCSEYALKQYFGYKNTLRGVSRSSYNQAQWISLLKTELDAGRPVLYTGYGTGGGHAFVCDGYNDNDYFHFNWGWGGNSDGYFPTNALNPGSLGTGGGTGGFNSGQQALIGIEPPSGGGGGTTNSIDLRLYSSIGMSNTSVWFGTTFSVTVGVGNWGNSTFSGQLGAAIFDKNGDFIDFLDSKSASLQSTYFDTYTFNKSASTLFVPGDYYVAIFYKTNAGDWTIVKDGSYSNLKQFEIYYYDDIEVNSNFTITGGKLIQGQSATVNVDILNDGNSTFYGEFRVSLANLDGSWVQNIQIRNESDGLEPNYHYTNGLNFTGTITVAPGTYLLEVGYKKNGASSWYYAGSYYYQNPIYVTVQASSLSPDQYETNNTVSQAYALAVNFSGNTASRNTTGSNLHTGTDNDFYKINLPSGYNYTINTRLHDAYSSGNGNSYSVDALFSYSTDGSTWSETYDDVMAGNISVQNGGTVYFHVAPYFSGETGTYLLDMTISRTQTISPDQYETNNTVSQAYNLPLSFTGNKATKNTIGSNFHIGTDIDYYKINLPSGYNYTINARLHDTYSSGNGNSYSVDALFSYSTDGSTWSETYDDVMAGNISVQNGGTVYFHVVPYFAGDAGTYLLDMNINRTQTTTNIEDLELANLIKIYPNPAKDFITIDLSEFAGDVNSFAIISAQGQQLASFTVADNEKNIQFPLHGFSNGIYFIQLHSTKGILTRKIVMSR